VTWSRTERGNKGFDRQFTLSSPKFARVVLAPASRPEDIEDGRCAHFEFCSRHLIDERAHAAARAEAA
jgi:hypothetical protein